MSQMKPGTNYVIHLPSPSHIIRTNMNMHQIFFILGQFVWAMNCSDYGRRRRLTFISPLRQVLNSFSFSLDFFLCGESDGGPTCSYFIQSRHSFLEISGISGIQNHYIFAKNKRGKPGMNESENPEILASDSFLL